MPKYLKEILRAGRYWVSRRDGSGEVVPFDVSADDVREMYRTSKAMLSAGLYAPVPLEHQDSAPVTRAERLARKVGYNAGFLEDVHLGKDGSLWGTLDVSYLPGATTDEEITNRLTKSIRYVSPYIVPSYRDGAGREWRQAICHLALTAQPVWSGQRPFSGDGASVLMSMPSNRLHRFPITKGVSLSVETNFQETLMNTFQQIQALIQRLASADEETLQRALEALTEAVGQENVDAQAQAQDGLDGAGMVSIPAPAVMSRSTERPLTAKERKASADRAAQERCGEEMARMR